MVETRRSERVLAYEALHNLQWALDSLPDDHPAAYYVQQAIVAADQHWRKLHGDYDQPAAGKARPAPQAADSSPPALM
jgi:hypothetical protein